MGRILRRTMSVVLVCSIAWAIPVHAATPKADRQRAVAAGRFIVASQSANGSFAGFSPVGSTADAVLELVALGRGAAPLRKALGFLRRQVVRGNVDTVGLQAKVVLAVEAAGQDPTSFGGKDLLRHITDTFRPNGRFGTAAVLDQALAILALRSAGVALNLKAATWLAGAQCPDGGWQYDRPYRPSENRHCIDHSNRNDFYGSDSNTTAYAIMALQGLTSPSHDPFAFLDRLRDRTRGPAHGGWGFTWGFRTTDANSTALVLQAYAAAGMAVPVGSAAALRRLQYPCGAVAYSWKKGKRTGPDLGRLDRSGPRLPPRAAAGHRRPSAGTSRRRPARRSAHAPSARGHAGRGRRDAGRGDARGQRRGGRVRGRDRPARGARGGYGFALDRLLRGAGRPDRDRHPPDPTCRRAARPDVRARLRRPGRVPAPGGRPGGRRLLRRTIRTSGGTGTGMAETGGPGHRPAPPRRPSGAATWRAGSGERAIRRRPTRCPRASGSTRSARRWPSRPRSRARRRASARPTVTPSRPASPAGAAGRRRRRAHGRQHRRPGDPSSSPAMQIVAAGPPPAPPAHGGVPPGVPIAAALAIVFVGAGLVRARGRKDAQP